MIYPISVPPSHADSLVTHYVAYMYCYWLQNDRDSLVVALFTRHGENASS